MSEAQRLADQTKNETGRDIKIVPFSWMRAGSGTAWLPPLDLAADFSIPFEYPACNAILVWGDPAVGRVGMPALQSYYNSTFYPWAKQMLEQRCECQASKCSNHGSCVRNETECHCADGWTGSDCSKQVTPATGRSMSTNVLRGSAALEYAIAAGATVPPSDSVVCPDGIAYCPAGNTCGQLTTGMWACCPLPNAVNCGSHSQCCPVGTQCDLQNNVCFDPSE